MKRIYWMALIALVFSACGQSGETQQTEAQQERDSLQRIINEKDIELNDIMGTFNEVQEGINRINEAEGRVTVADANPETASNRTIIKENMQFIEEAMQQNRNLIAQLQEKLRRSSFNADKLKKTIETLQAQIEQQSSRIQELEASLAEKEAMIAAQGEEINNLNENVSTLSADNASKAKTVAAQDKELNKAWFVFGTKAELKEQKILTNGDVLRSSNYNKDYFTQIDIRYNKEIKLYSKNAKLLTSHPAGSYQLAKNANGQYELRITDPSKFWSASKYLVIQVK